MSFVSARATRTAIIVIALSGAGLWALHAMDARADPPPHEDSSPCAEGRALFAAKLAYLEARIAPEPSQEDAWRTFRKRHALVCGRGRPRLHRGPSAPALGRCRRTAETDGEACGRDAGDVRRNGERLCGDRSQSDRSATGHPVAEHRSLSAVRAAFPGRICSPRQRHRPEAAARASRNPTAQRSLRELRRSDLLERLARPYEARAPILAHQP